MNKDTILITGGAKRVGAELVRFFAARDFEVVIHCHHSRDEAYELSSQCEGSTVVEADLSDMRAVGEVFSTIGKPVNYLINNAAVFKNDKQGDPDGSIWDFNMDVNAKAPLLLSRCFADQLAQGEKGAILNIVDYSIVRTPYNFISYNASKEALWSVTKGLALNLAPTVRVNAIGLGNTLPNAKETQEHFVHACDSSPLKIGADTEQVAQAAHFMLTAASVTGQLLLLDSGKHMMGPEAY